jgi:hypothetical protein
MNKVGPQAIGEAPDSEPLTRSLNPSWNPAWEESPSGGQPSPGVLPSVWSFAAVSELYGLLFFCCSHDLLQAA